ncbi:hypothetical protein K7640_28890 [Micromonospora sp. PLK6-60]|uniref:hypothetical protein n=1 Tax=Micromonospora sp. PLK6-60 TaxID=2873383 RepID=UPI001CA65A79|nr:hypothetical protein [Micromonospora sp. PLK6-60]MBY8875851.1 hypothetical protein [Micromonospora sp. PLK6-60]
MGGTEPGSAREEAERLVAALLAMTRPPAAGAAAAGWGSLGGIISGVLNHTGERSVPGPGPTARPAGGGFATGAPECCVCPICRGIAAVRDPSPEFAERLATGAGDLAAGVASLLRAFGSAGAPSPTPDDRARATPGDADGDHVWREATRTGHDSQPAPEQDVWSAATRGEGSADPGAPVPPADGPDAPVTDRSPADRPVVPASRASGEAGGDAPGDEA